MEPDQSVLTIQVSEVFLKDGEALLGKCKAFRCNNGKSASFGCTKNVQELGHTTIY